MDGFEHQPLWAFYNFDVRPGEQTESFPDWFGNHNPTRLINLQCHAIKHGTWHGFWQAALPDALLLCSSVRVSSPGLFQLGAKPRRICVGRRRLRQLAPEYLRAAWIALGGEHIAELVNRRRIRADRHRPNAICHRLPLESHQGPRHSRLGPAVFRLEGNDALVRVERLLIPAVREMIFALVDQLGQSLL